MPLSLSHRFAHASAAVFAILFSLPVQAQIVPDATLGTQAIGACGGAGGTCVIINGSLRGSNLFHSFLQFSLPNGEFAPFITNPAIQNVIVRVTGVGKPFISNINGTIATSNPANFFLLNPNGIVFGPNALIFVGGSFLASTAERMLFQDGTVFNTRDQTVAPLLTVSVPIGLQLGQTPGNIQMQGTFLSAGNTDRFSDFALVGGDVTLDDSIVLAPGRRVELSGIGAGGSIGLNVNGNRLSLSVPTDVIRANVRLTNRSQVRVEAGQGGTIAVNGQNIQLLNQSLLNSGIAQGTGSLTSQSGNITLNAVGEILLDQNSLVLNNVGRNSIGNGGAIDVQANSLVFTNGGQFGAATFGKGNGGDVAVRAQSIAADGGSNNFRSGIFTNVESSGEGNGGAIDVQANSLTFTNGGQFAAATFGKGNGGDVAIRAQSIAADGGSNNFRSGIFTNVESSGEGNGGAIDVQANSLTFTNGGQFAAAAFGKGNGASISIRAQSITADGESNSFRSGIFTNVENGGEGNGGTIDVQTNSLIFTNGGQFAAATFGKGNGGNASVRAQSIAVDGGSNSFRSGIFTNVESSGEGNGGAIDVQANSLVFTNGGQFAAATFGKGNAGKIQIAVSDSIKITGTDSRSGYSSGVFTNTFSDFEGGNITINANHLVVSDGAVLNAQTRSDGAGGNILLNVRAVELQRGGQLLSTTEGNGRAGIININATEQITLSDRDPTFAIRFAQFGRTVAPVTQNSGIYVRSTGNGASGNIEINTPILRLDNQAQINAQSATGDGGNITLNVRDLLLMRRGSQISTTAGSEQFGGNGGNITINAPSGFIVGVKGENSDITANAFTGSGGRVNITTQGIYGLQFRPRLTEFSDITASSTFGVSGVVAINTLGIDPSRGLQQLPGGLVDPSNRIDQKCAAGSAFRRSSFTVTGRGGLPENPFDPLQSGEGTATWVEASTDSPQPSSLETSSPQHSFTPPLLIEADSLMMDKDGSVQLVASRSIAAPDSSWHLPSCDLVKERDR